MKYGLKWRQGGQKNSVWLFRISDVTINKIYKQIDEAHNN